MSLKLNFLYKITIQEEQKQSICLYSDDYWFGLVNCVLRLIDSEVISRRHTHFTVPCEGQEARFYTVPTGNRTPGRRVTVHYTAAAPRQLHPMTITHPISYHRGDGNGLCTLRKAKRIRTDFLVGYSSWKKSNRFTHTIQCFIADKITDLTILYRSVRFSYMNYCPVTKPGRCHLIVELRHSDF